MSSGKLSLRFIPPLRFACGPPVHEATGGHGFPEDISRLRTDQKVQPSFRVAETREFPPGQPAPKA